MWRESDPFVCTARLETGPPTPGESTFINLVRGHVPGSDTDLLVTGRTICHMGGESARYVDQEVAAHLRTDMAHAGQVLDAAVEYICSGVRFG